MSLPLEDYALIGDTHTAGLVSRGGSIDWLCLPRFDSGACFASLLGDVDHGSWELAPEGESERRDAATVPTPWSSKPTTAPRGRGSRHGFHDTPSRPGACRAHGRGIRGAVPMQTALRLRFDYGLAVPWLRPGAAISPRSPVPMRSTSTATCRSTSSQGRVVAVRGPGG
jgi:hypothetical protein